MKIKKCKHCKEAKRVEEFVRLTALKNNVTAICLSCNRKKQRTYVEKLKDGTIEAF